MQLVGRRDLPGAITAALHGNAEVGTKAIESLGFGSLTHYQWAQLATPDGDFGEWGDKAVEEWNRCEKNYSIPVFPHVSIGWDNNPRFTSYHGPVIVNNPPEAFKRFLETAKEFIDSRALPAPLVTINSWNEWTEASYLLPDKKYKYGYLEAVRDVFGSNVG
jgi:hypothetical protein